MDDDFDLEDELERELEAGSTELETDKQVKSTSESAAAEATAGQAAILQAQSAPDSKQRDDMPSSSGVARGVQGTFGVSLTGTGSDQQRKMAILNLLTPEQESRYEAFTRSTLGAASMKKLLHSATGQAPHPHAVIVMRGIAKLFVGDIVETARMVAAEEGDDGPLQPMHIRKAYERLDKGGKILHRNKTPRKLRL